MNEKIALLIIGGMMTVSCSDWLDVIPKDSIVESDLFKESTGFQNSLNGVYELMSGDKLYGRELSYGLIDAMGQVYYLTDNSWYSGINKNHYYYQAAKFQYDANPNIKDAFEGIWQTAYKAIANCNNIIGHIGELRTTDFRLGEAERNLIKGEAMAARAILHFDLLRLFAPAPVTEDGGLYIPYVTVFPYYGGQSPLSVKETMGKIVGDLEEAKKMIMAYDTLNMANRSLLSRDFRFEPTMTSVHSEDGSDVEMRVFYQYRGYRINALAVTAMLARVYSWWGGDKLQLAADNANEVIGFLAYQAEGVKALGYTKDNLEVDRKFILDLIFCLSNPLLQQTYAEGYLSEKSNSFLCLNKYNKIWKDDLADGGDTRLGLINHKEWEWDAPLKNVRPAGSGKLITVTEDMVPMIRLSEMHFVLAEYCASTGNYAGAAENIRQVRMGRKCDGNKDLGITDMTTFKTRLLSEVCREFFSEGQTFFYYKKYNEPLIKGMDTGAFVVQKPDSENIN